MFAYLQPDGSWFLSNAGIVLAGERSVHVDTTATVRRTQALLEAARRVGAPSRRLLVATHHHGDHTNGTATLDPEVMIAQRSVPEELATGIVVPPPGVFTPVEWGEIDVRMPDVLFDDGLTLRFDDHEIEVRAAGRPAHTRGDAVVWLPESRVLFAGDLLFVGGTPFALGGSVQGWIEVIAWLRTFDADVIVPGHGPLATTADLDAVERYLRFVWHLAHEAHEAGVPPLEAARSVDLGEFAAWLDPERLVGNVHRAIAELDGREVDVLAAFGDMIAYNGGRPLTCHA
ncbi:MBL fold metallo-hydrolase [Acidimicrobium ferrooxidans]|uniref:MBL fold metallo-hydrolase n=1 Tax=Acidimicrobium ferrooxidans TaxID=53635 RepID=UPI00019DDF31|nr:MBL fold metallo-hydrolase [Acidimicrobium ferrooxidans]